MATRQLQPREECYRWAIEQLDEAFGQDRVRVTPRNHYHVIRVAIAMPTGHSEELVLRDPVQDLNKREKKEEYLAGWIGRTRTSMAVMRPPLMSMPVQVAAG